MAIAWRCALVFGATAGLALAPTIVPLGEAGLDLPQAAVLIAIGALALVAVRPDGMRQARRRATDDPAVPEPAPRRPPSPWLAWPWLVAIASLAAVAGTVIGEARLAALDADAYRGPIDARVAVRGTIAEVPRVAEGELRAIVATAEGRLLVKAPQPRDELDVGEEVRATGVVREPVEWEAGRLRIRGVRRVVAARALEPTGGVRDGLAGAVDAIRERAEAALERGMRDPEAALARGFVLGQDDRIERPTIEDFRRSGLAHLLAVSGQNVILLSLLAIPILALLGLGLRARLLVVVALIALYVPLTGAGPSIQRAAVMGIAGIVALLAGRPQHRWYALALAAAVTLLANPRAAGDVGWQLSFAAVVGILLWSRPIASTLRRALRAPDRGVDWRAGLAEGAAMTTAATVATAPVSAHHFEMVSIAALPANLLALPAVAPVMWLGMASAALGQLPWAPIAPLNWICAQLIAYIAQVGRWLGDPGWATAGISAPAPAVLVAVAAAVALAALLAARAVERRAQLRAPARGATALATAGLATVLVVAPVPSGSGSAESPARAELRITALDVGQGDAILLEPREGRPLLVDTGPVVADVARILRERGIEELAAVALTHDDADHAGGLPAVLGEVRVGALLHAGTGRRLRAAARAAGAKLVALRRGDALRLGELGIRVLWPPQLTGRAGTASEPNDRSLVLHVRWRELDLLLTGDAESEAVPLDPGDIEILKVPHHGSEDAGLPALLERTDPRLAVISVGAGNPYGHPHPSTLAALRDAGVAVLRTDRQGDVVLDAAAGAVRIGE